MHVIFLTILHAEVSHISHWGWREERLYSSFPKPPQVSMAGAVIGRKVFMHQLGLVSLLGTIFDLSRKTST